MNKKTTRAVLAAFLAAAAFCFPFCKGSEQKKDVTLDVWHYFESDGERAGMQRVADEFMAANPGVRVNVTYVPRDELIKQYMMGAVSGELPDISMMDNPDMAAYIEMGICLDVTDKFNVWEEKDYYYEGPLNSCKRNGRIYGLPHNSNCLELFYDVDQLREAGVTPPATWDELTAACAALKKAYPGLYPLGFSSNNNEEGTFQFMPFLISSGGSLDNLASPESVRAVAYWKDLVEAGYVPRDVINWGQSELNAQFTSGNVIMQVNGPWNISILRANAPGKNWNVTLLPKDKKYASVLGGENFAVTKACEDAGTGWAYLSTLCSGKNVAEYCAAVGKFSPRSDGSQFSNVWDTDPILKVFNEGMQYAMPRGPHPRWNEFSAVISNALQEVLTGAKTPEAAMRDAQRAGEAVMAN
ncbi:MAG: sugar ABC transporter substrate-binding protein [Treponema sp.]|jgi:multiple sugar transport system substrate-binding protein|nr:sugar ABC transporter substrate-binding protein [Treponema sp.]